MRSIRITIDNCIFGFHRYYYADIIHKKNFFFKIILTISVHKSNSVLYVFIHLFRRRCCWLLLLAAAAAATASPYKKRIFWSTKRFPYFQRYSSESISRKPSPPPPPYREGDTFGGRGGVDGVYYYIRTHARTPRGGRGRGGGGRVEMDGRYGGKARRRKEKERIYTDG